MWNSLKVTNHDSVTSQIPVLYLNGQMGQTLLNFLQTVCPEDSHGSCSQPFIESPRYQLALSGSQNPLKERLEPCDLGTWPVV